MPQLGSQLVAPCSIIDNHCPVGATGDVVALKNGENYLFQAKQTKSSGGNDAIQEIYTAKNYYENKFNEKFSFL